MKIIYLKDVPVYGDEIGSFFATEYDPEVDIPKFERAFKSWKQDRHDQMQIGGRAPNLSDGFTEGLFCLATNSVRYSKAPENKKSMGFGGCTQKLSNSSLDTYNIKKGETEQIKSSIIDGTDCTSFGPTSKQDVVYFMHFYRLDGSFDLYRIEDNVLQSTVIKEDGTTFADKKLTGQRPHFSLLDKVITPNQIDPIKTNVKLW
tara:strand:- start:1024 stop:1632 length:609 start_codon:yes stop_codon:yes gene_type:complete